MWILVIFLFFQPVISEYQKYYCILDYYLNVINTDVHLKPNVVTYIETVNFTSIYNSDENDQICTMTFYIEPSSINKSVIVVITNPILLNHLFYISENENIFLWTWETEMYLRELNLRIYDFQGFVIHNELENNECFLESVSNPYHFNDENQILYIRSSILKVNERKNPCNWHFSAPDGYGFKIVIVEFNAVSDVTLAVTNSTNFYIVNQHSVIIDKPYYNEDQNLYIFLSNSNQSFLLRYEFGAYITIIKTKFEVVDAKCVIDDDDSWTSNYYHSNGYPNNAYCNYTLEIPPNTIVIAQRHDDYIIEKADFVIYFDVLSNSYEHINNNDDAKAFYAFKNNSIRKINWEFKSDGSVRGGGFKVYFDTIYCFCNSPIFFVYCDGTYYAYHVTNTTSSVAYCGNMKCNSTIKLDPSYPKHLFIQLTIVTSAYPSKLIDFTDNFRLITDNETIVSVSSTNFSYTMVQVYINPNSTNIFESLTADTELLIPRELYLELLATERPKLKKKAVLTKQKPYFFLDIRTLSTDIFSIEIDDALENLFIEIYVNRETSEGINFYKDEALTKLIDTYDCFSDNSFYCKTNTKKLFFSYYPIDGPDMLIPYIFMLFQMGSKEFTGDCLFNTGAFKNTFDNPITFSDIAGVNGTCKVTILNDFMSIPYLYKALNISFYIQKIWTSSLKDNVKVFVGSEDDLLLLFEFNQKTSSEWQRIVMNSPFYVFEIPVNSSLLISTNISEPHVQNEIKPYEYRTIIQSPFYLFEGGPYCYSKFSIDENIYVTFNVTYFEIPTFLTFQFFVDNQLQSVEKIGTIFTLTNVSVFMCYIGQEELLQTSKLLGIIFEMYIKMDNNSIIDTTTNISPLPITTPSTTTALITTSTTTDIHSSNVIYKILFVFGFLVFLILCCLFLCLRKFDT